MPRVVHRYQVQAAYSVKKRLGRLNAVLLTGDKASFGQPKKKSAYDKTSKAFGDAHAGRYDTYFHQSSIREP